MTYKLLILSLSSTATIWGAAGWGQKWENLHHRPSPTKLWAICQCHQTALLTSLFSMQLSGITVFSQIGLPSTKLPLTGPRYSWPNCMKLCTCLPNYFFWQIVCFWGTHSFLLHSLCFPQDSASFQLVSPYSLLLLALATINLCSASMDLSILKISYKWNIVCDLLCLAFFILNDVFKT